MITIEQAGRLRKAGVLWAPAAGDRFVVPDRDMDEDVFVVSDMTVEVHDYQGSKVIGFKSPVRNVTTRSVGEPIGGSMFDISASVAHRSRTMTCAERSRVGSAAVFTRTVRNGFTASVAIETPHVD